jgi:PPM family protein phosphatase
MNAKSEQYRLTVAANTHPGLVRKINQDSCFATARRPAEGISRGLLLVADGMGGHQAGEIASKLAVETISGELSWIISDDQPPDGSGAKCPTTQQQLEENRVAWEQTLEAALRNAVEKANLLIHDYARQNPEQAGNLGCTATCVLVCGNRAIVANVGDSRTYRLRQGGVEQITADHSLVWQLVQEGHLTETELFEHPHRNIVTRALGSRPGVAVDVQSCTLDAGDRLLLCSDGLWEMIRDINEISRLARAEPLEAAVDDLIAAANHYGGLDNIAVVLAKLEAA